MFKHFIAVASVYSEGLRIAWHYSDDEFDNSEVHSFLNLFKKYHGDLQLGTHLVSTTSLEWDSVVELDSYFEGVLPISKKMDFIKTAGYDNELSALDVSKYILSKTPVTQLKLQKLVYLCYEKFLLETKKSLFSEKVVAWQYGPVVKEMYEEYRTYGSSNIPYEEDDAIEIILDMHYEVPSSFMRILSSDVGLNAINVIDEVIEEYKGFSANQLVDLTHEEHRPWSKVNRNEQITDSIILSCY
ncbi:MAG: DUF4065 domain-containing protein [Solibacillus sp.]